MKKRIFCNENNSRVSSCNLLIIYKIHALILFMRFEKIPYYLRQSIDAIVSHARKNITVHYTENNIMAGTSQSRAAIGCQIIDHNNYSEYFYEPNKFEILEPKVIKCMDQRSAHQNGILALKRWENEVREFLSRPVRKIEESQPRTTKK